MPQVTLEVTHMKNFPSCHIINTTHHAIFITLVLSPITNFSQVLFLKLTSPRNVEGETKMQVEMQDEMAGHAAIPSQWTQAL